MLFVKRKVKSPKPTWGTRIKKNCATKCFWRGHKICSTDQFGKIVSFVLAHVTFVWTETLKSFKALLLKKVEFWLLFQIKEKVPQKSSGKQKPFTWFRRSIRLLEFRVEMKNESRRLEHKGQKALILDF